MMIAQINPITQRNDFRNFSKWNLEQVGVSQFHHIKYSLYPNQDDPWRLIIVTPSAKRVNTIAIDASLLTEVAEAINGKTEARPATQAPSIGPTWWSKVNAITIPGRIPCASPIRPFFEQRWIANHSLTSKPSTPWGLSGYYAIIQRRPSSKKTWVGSNLG